MSARVIARREDGTEVDMTDQVHALWPLLDRARHGDELDVEDTERAIAVGIAAGLPVKDLEDHHRIQLRRREHNANQERERLAREAWRNSPVEVTLAHPCKGTFSPDRLLPPETVVTMPLWEAENLDRYGRLVRPNPISPKPLEVL